MGEVRRRYHEELRALEDEVQQTGTQARLLLEKALRALGRGDPVVGDEVIGGDDEVDIGEQVAFLVTGEFREFTDASHPEVEHPELLERGGSPT